MPQGRRKVPFSGKAKKAQLQAKKEKKAFSHPETLRGLRSVPAAGGHDNDDSSGQEDGARVLLKVNHQPKVGRGQSNSNRYALHFYHMTEAELAEQKERALHAIFPVAEQELEVAMEKFFPPGLDFPKRPPWDFSMSREQLDACEHRYFTEYISSVERNFSLKDLGYFELNLETWRQLWRVLEMSDIILVIVDIRYAALMFPPSLYAHVMAHLHKDMVLVLNKVDLAPESLVVAWRHYFKDTYPGLAAVLTFTSFPSYNLRGNQCNKTGLQVRRRRGKLRMAAEGSQKLLEACKDIVKDAVELTSWQDKIREEMTLEYECDDQVEVEETINLKQVDTSFTEHIKYKDGVLTIGCVGQPNVGKSSVINAIMGRKVVSVSRTPGHTKHFQTIHITRNVRLCDCPGLVFPSVTPKTLQVLMGSYPISQLREPYSCIRYLAERLDLPRALALKHPEGEQQWSPMEICESWAMKRGFYTARAARLDTYRAANSVLRMALEGKLCLCLRPPGFTSNKEFWASHEDTAEVRWIQARDDNNDTPDHSDQSTGEEGDSDGAHTQTSSEDERGPTSGLGTVNKFAALSDSS